MTQATISPRIVDFDDPTFDPFSTFDSANQSDTNADTYDWIAQRRSEAPVHKLCSRTELGVAPDPSLADLPHYLVVGTEAVNEALTKPEIYSNTVWQRNIGQVFGRSVTTMDAPDHTRYRRIFQKAFLPTVVNKWGESVVDPAVNGLMDKFKGRNKADLVSEFTHYFPFHIIYRQLDLPGEDREVFHKLAVGLTCIITDLQHGIEACGKLGDYYSWLLEERRTRPGNDLVSALAVAESEGERLPDEVIISFLRQLMNAGGDTTYRATSSLLLGLLSNPEQYKALCEDRSLLPQAIEEGLRWEGPVVFTLRNTLKDTVLGGMEIPAGAVLDVALGAVNRDPGLFEDPDQFNIFRKRTRHMAFATGSHVCIGQHLARVEITRALTAIMDRLPNLRLDPDMPAPKVNGVNLRVPASIPVYFG